MADVLSFRLRSVQYVSLRQPLRCWYQSSLLAQMAGAGALVSLLLGIDSQVGQSLVIAIVGVLMIFYVFIGGMKGTTWVQIIKATLLLIGVGVMSVWMLGLFGFNFSAILGEAANVAGTSAILDPGLQYGINTLTKLDFISLGLALVLGTAGLPHVLMRFYTVPTAKEARKSVVWAIWLIGGFYLCTLVLGFGAAVLVGPDVIADAPGGQNSAAALLAYELGGTLLLGIISAVVCYHPGGGRRSDHYRFGVVCPRYLRSSIKKGKLDTRGEMRAGRATVVVVGILAILGGIGAQGQNVAFLVALAFAVAASANLPTIIYSLFWKNFTTRGALWSMYGGLISSITLILFSPVLWGAETSFFPDVDLAIYPLTNPGIISIPLSFLLGWIGSKTSKVRENADKQAEMEVRSLTGVGAEKATDH